MSARTIQPKSRPSVRAETPLLALALTGFLAATGCGDDSSSEPSPAADGGVESSTSGESESRATESTGMASESTTDESSNGATEADSGVGTSAPNTSSVDSWSDAGVSTLDTSPSTASSDVFASSDETLVTEGDGGAEPTPVDVDQDGVSVADGDCNDFNDSVFPGAPEVALDGEDSDCDGEDAPAMNLVWSAAETNNTVDALAAMDADEDGSISLEEFNAQCARGAKLSVDSRPGVLQYHASCAGTNSCRGMIMQVWGELYEHSCRGVNYCAGWSCVETAEDEGRTGEQAFDAAHCGYCHSGGTDAGAFAFNVPVPPGNDTEAYLENFWSSRSDDYLRSIIAFGVNYTLPDGYHIANMPPAYFLISREEIDTLIDHLRSLPLTSHDMALPGVDGGAPM